MLHLDVSKEPCLPLKKVGRQVAAAGVCHHCQIPTGTAAEKHTEGGRSYTVCPVCHVCRHLDHAGIIGAGTMVWLPELTQAQLNATCMFIFITLLAPRDELIDAVFVERMKILYKTFESRCAPVVTLFGGKNSLFDASNPLFFAQEIDRLRPETRAELASKLDGLRLLPSPKVFMPFARSAMPEILKKYPLKTWTNIESKLTQRVLQGDLNH